MSGITRSQPKETQEHTSLLAPSSTRGRYFNYGYRSTTPAQRKVSSKYDPENPNRDKLGTYDGVFVPTALNVLSILMFLRFGFLLGQLGIILALGFLLLSYAINLLTTLSISAISTNGTVRGGGAYYMISRSLGPEFGGSIGLVFFLGQVLNGGMNAVGVIEPILYNFGSSLPYEPPAAIWEILPRGRWVEFGYATVILLICLGVALIGSQTVSRAGNFLFCILAASTASIPISTLIMQPFQHGDMVYTGPSWETFKGNLLPHLTKGAAGSLLKGKETFNDLFGIMFPATAGIFAGAGMSSELRKPSKSIPKGTLWGLLFTFICYTFVAISMAFSIPRQTFQRDVQVIQSVSAGPWIILMGELATSLFSTIMGLVGAAYVLEAIANDSIIPGISIFHKKPLAALLFTWILTQLCLFLNVNKIAVFITMTFLMTFAVMNLACFLLVISSAPNFRPSFKYFDRFTALTGALMSTAAMFVVDGLSASAVILGMMILFIVIHYLCPPKPWGDVSQSLIYHQVRKYLLRLRQDNIKYWRPQVLLLVDNPRTSWNLIKFCNNLKKGGLYILGHVTVTGNFQEQFQELKKQQKAWMSIRELTKIKAFVQIGTGPTLPWGVRNVFLGSGLGGMRPNITVLGFFDLKHYHKISSSELTTNQAHAKNCDGYLNINQSEERLPTDDCKNEDKIKVQQWVEILEDLSLMHSNIAIAHAFQKLNTDELKNRKEYEEKKCIDLYPIQMCAKMKVQSDFPSVVTTNFDTYTLILQLGAILVTVPEWKRTHRLRVILFVEKHLDRNEELRRMQNLLAVLRIEAEVLVVALDQFQVYNTIVKGDPVNFDYVNSILKDDLWWQDLVEARNTLKPKRRFSTVDTSQDEPVAMKAQPQKYKLSKLQRLGVSFTMSSSMPHNASFLSDSLDDDTETGSIRDPSPSIPLMKDRIDYEYTRKRNNSSGRVMSPTRRNIEEMNKNTPRPVFSSNKLPNTKVLEDQSGDKPTIVPVMESSSPGSTTGGSRGQGFSDLSHNYSGDSLLVSMQNLAFNDLPSRAQHLILNDIMSQTSEGSDLIFSTLPIPPLGTHQDEEASLCYVEDLHTWLEGLPATMLINSQTMTVTTAL
ncbi:vacuolar cation-chloride cotransporter 1 [Zygosaccharomyces mellis]|uniref:Vacuolar cation-chloride cotransporter 1 n=1 Tax=Zygosaccharomyces mellis TaxID=42258 RepID=A0A4C2E2Q3_9SACH|nr:vacuolar cation-chloride cotransporter 1 [Zygosaccharomyces mellis]